MKIKLNAVEFDVLPVPRQLRAALLQQPSIRPGILREVYVHTRAEGGKTIGPTSPQGGVMLPNGLSFFVPKAGSADAPEIAEGPSKKMSERFIEAVGARDMRELQDAVHRLFGASQRALPINDFAALNPVADWRLLMGTDFAVLQLVNAARNLSAFVIVPAQVGFVATVTEEGEGLPEVMATKPGLLQNQPGFIIPPSTQPGESARRIALEQRVRELAAALDGRTPAELPADDPRQSESQRLSVEWAMLFPRTGAQRPQQPAASVRRA
ncbi:hypothetical protein BVG79_02246 [Ketogulonicigenium robustum]|uniref:Uncharacterized protein n=1 Tax=Ketogulonicigenium robustum TaxID=92947 RepID=A0A1W6P280_9RHOB|nr:hypothetical protein [Ketogulonicigenium robustum]ARO15586.1 hypothetical protein BVG79_02246 [Ketogulonicigenium robustum]